MPAEWRIGYRYHRFPTAHKEDPPAPAAIAALGAGTSEGVKLAPTGSSGQREGRGGMGEELWQCIAATPVCKIATSCTKYFVIFPIHSGLQVAFLEVYVSSEFFAVLSVPKVPLCLMTRYHINCP